MLKNIFFNSSNNPISPFQHLRAFFFFFSISNVSFFPSPWYYHPKYSTRCFKSRCAISGDLTVQGIRTASNSTSIWEHLLLLTKLYIVICSKNTSITNKTLCVFIIYASNITWVTYSFHIWPNIKVVKVISPSPCIINFTSSQIKLPRCLYNSKKTKKNQNIDLESDKTRKIWNWSCCIF